MLKKKVPPTNRTKQCRTSSSAAEIIASNVDLLSEILLRVPAKSLIKFKSVSKQWLSFISDSGFARNHTHQYPALPPAGLYFYSGQSPEFMLNDRITRVSLRGHPQTTLPDFSFLNGSGPTVCHSSNGLMLCSSGDYEEFVVCNPTTQKFVVLPALTAKSKSYIVFGSYLVFDPKKSPYYKVVVVSYSYHLNPSKFDVYSSESGSWKSTTLAARIGHWWGIKYGAVRDGAIIAMSCGAKRDGSANHDYLCFRFDVAEEKLTSIQVPFTYRKFLYLGECGGQLLLIQAPRYQATEFRVLELMEDENNFWWTVKYVVDLAPLILPGRRGGRSCIFSVIGVMDVAPNENDLAVVLEVLFDLPGADLRVEIIKYDIKCKTLKVLCDFPGADLLTSQPSYRFIESLTPV